MNVLLTSLLFCFALHSLSFKDKLLEGSGNDYIIYDQKKTYTAYVIRDITDAQLIIEEISIPSHLKSKKEEWKEWLEKGAPGNTSSLMYSIDLKDHTLLEGYSFTKGCYITSQREKPLIAQMLSLELQMIPEQNRRRMGAKPSQATLADRSLWNPPLFIEGKKESYAAAANKTISNEIVAYESVWKKDDTELSGKRIELYFHQKNPFPHWIEVSDGGLGKKMRALDCGHLSTRSTKELPKRPPQILKVKHTGKNFELTIRNPSHFKDFILYAYDPEREERELLLVDILASKQTKGEEKLFCSANKNYPLQPLVQYHWLLVPQSAPHLSSDM